MNTGPALVSILRQGDTLVASVNTALDDSEMLRFQHDLIEQIDPQDLETVLDEISGELAGLGYPVSHGT